jgi:hypothetical protein
MGLEIAPFYFTLFSAHYRPLNFLLCNTTTKNISPRYGLKNSLVCLARFQGSHAMHDHEQARTAKADPTP